MITLTCKCYFFARPYAANYADDCPPDARPYVATNIAPFRFRYFTNECNYHGYHTCELVDYAGAHGFNVLDPYKRSTNQFLHLPANTLWLNQGGWDWTKLMPTNGVPAGRYDLLDPAVFSPVLDKQIVSNQNRSVMMLDLEHNSPYSNLYPCLALSELRAQSWYPAAGTPEERAAFEARYYAGFAYTYTGPVDTSHAKGYDFVGIYGWSPFPKTWFGLEVADPDPATDFFWNAYGRTVYEHVDVLYPSLYNYYWNTFGNAAFTLANIDLNARFVAASAVRKPLRPYYWNQFHGGGDGWRWWEDQAIPVEDMRGMMTLAFFTGFDGFVLWNTTGSGSHVIPKPPAANTDHTIRDTFSVTADGASAPTVFRRYDAIHILGATNGVAEFQLIEKTNAAGNYGVATNKPVYHLDSETLRAHVRPLAESVYGLVEGLALAKPYEYLLRHGEVKIDVPAQLQFKDGRPIVRRVKLGPTTSSAPSTRSGRCSRRRAASR